MEKNLGTSYALSKECSGQLVTKHEIMKIQITDTINTRQSSSMTMLDPKQQKMTYRKGKVYYNTYLPYCCCCIPCYNCTTNSWEIQMNGEKVVQSKIPFCCPRFGPYYVQSKQDIRIGQLQPHCYSCQSCPCSMCCTDCIYLNVQDESMNLLYKVKRQSCNCFGGRKWDVLDNSDRIRGGFQPTGSCCWPRFLINLPDASQKDKKLVLSSLNFLP